MGLTRPFTRRRHAPACRRLAPSRPTVVNFGGAAVRLIDSTTLSFSGLSSAWTRFSHNTCGAKPRSALDPLIATRNPNHDDNRGTGFEVRHCEPMRPKDSHNRS